MRLRNYGAMKEKINYLYLLSMTLIPAKKLLITINLILKKLILNRDACVMNLTAQELWVFQQIN